MIALVIFVICKRAFVGSVESRKAHEMVLSGAYNLVLVTVIISRYLIRNFLCIAFH